MSRLKDKVQSVLDECRMLILGGEVLFSFSTQAVMEPAFGELSAAARAVCIAAMLGLAAALGLLMWPAAYHQIVCRGEGEPRLVRFAERALCVGLAPFAGAMSGGLYIVGERVAGAWLGVGLAAVFAVGAAWMLYGYPLWKGAGRRAMRRAEENEMGEETERVSDTTTKVQHVLTEARMVLPGAQALLGFGTIAVLTEKFEGLPAALKTVHVCGLGFIALSTLLLMTPAAYHRIAEGGEHTERLHRVATRLLLASMAALAPGLGAGMWVAVEVATGERWAGIAAGVGVVVVYYAAWFGWTWWVRRRVEKRRV